MEKDPQSLKHSIISLFHTEEYTETLLSAQTKSEVTGTNTGKFRKRKNLYEGQSMVCSDIPLSREQAVGTGCVDGDSLCHIKITVLTCTPFREGPEQVSSSVLQ